MRIERVEEICLDFLRQAENPLVPLKELYEHCIATEDVGSVLTEEGLLQFLRAHGEVTVVEGVSDDMPVTPKTFETAGIVMGPRAILKKRLPSRHEIKQMFEMQVAQMRTRLLEALEHAKKEKDPKAIEELEAAIENADTINERLQEL